MKANIVMSMVNPSTDALMSKVDSRYGLVVLAARRARQLMAGAETKAMNLSTKNVTNALEEIAEGKITYEIAKDFPEEPEEEAANEDALPAEEIHDEESLSSETADESTDEPEHAAETAEESTLKESQEEP